MGSSSISLVKEPRCMAMAAHAAIAPGSASPSRSSTTRKVGGGEASHDERAMRAGVQFPG